MKSFVVGSFLCFCCLSLLMVGGCDSGSPSGSSVPSLGPQLQVSLRPSLLDAKTAVLQIKNITGHQLQNLSLTFRNKDSNQQASYSLANLNAGEAVEIGVLEAGWSFEPNEEIEISHVRYGRAKYTTFRAEDGEVGIKQVWW